MYSTYELSLFVKVKIAINVQKKVMMFQYLQNEIYMF